MSISSHFLQLQTLPIIPAICSKPPLTNGLLTILFSTHQWSSDYPLLHSSAPTFSNRLTLAMISTPPDLIQLVPNLRMLSCTTIHRNHFLLNFSYTVLFCSFCHSTMVLTPSLHYILFLSLSFLMFDHGTITLGK